MSEVSLEFLKDKWYFLANADGSLAGAIRFEKAQKKDKGDKKAKVESGYIVFFQQNPWSEKEIIGALNRKEDILGFIKDFTDENNTRHVTISDAFELQELREILWSVFYNKFLDPHIRARVSLTARNFVSLNTSNNVKQLAAFYFVANTEGFLRELEVWESGYYSWFPK